MSYIKIEERDKQLYCEVNNITDILDVKYLPLKFIIHPFLSNDILYECDLLENMWASFATHRNIRALLYTNNNILIKEYLYRYENDSHHPDYELDEFWDYFSKLNKDNIGLILGAGDGTWGEWVRGINENNIKCHLVEASKRTFNRLKNNYKYNNFVEVYNLIISNEDANVNFYEIDDDGFNTISLEFLQSNNLKYNSSEIVKTTKINNFLENIGQVDWIRIDIEGLDYDVLKSIDIKYLYNLKMLQYEHLHLDDTKQKEIDNLFSRLGFKKLKFKIDTVYLKK